MFALVDCNNFYVSCERAFNPKIRNKPVVVLSNNDGCVVSRSNEITKIDSRNQNKLNGVLSLALGLPQITQTQL
jgi:nucleotidyltransferase/DNA polymerase involved in DNA repair